MQVGQVKVLYVVDEDQRKLSVLGDEFRLALDSADVDHDAVCQSCMLVDAMRDLRYFLVGLDGVDNSLGVGSHEERREAAIASELKDAGGLVLLEGHFEYLALVLPDVHHPVVPAESIYLLDDHLRLSCRS